MTLQADLPAKRHLTPLAPTARLRFGTHHDFQTELRRRVDEFLNNHGRHRRDCVQMYAKTVILLAWFFTSYFFLVFVATTWWQGLPLAISLGLAAGAIGFGVQHDGGHNAYSRLGWINKLTALTLDMLGGSSYLWRWKHVQFHHPFVNITEHDTDIDLRPFARLSPHQQRHGFHRWQHWYIWPLYGIMAIRWHFVSDFLEWIQGRLGTRPIPRPKGWDLVTLLGGKAVFFTFAFGIPICFHRIWVVAVLYVVATCVLGILLSIVFQLAHCVGEAEFPVPEADTGAMKNSWAVHQIETTVDFARRSWLVSWFLGGLNFQIEHHLFPGICHVNYPAISKVVEQTCRDYGVRYVEHRTIWSGVASHFRWLRRMGAAMPA